METVEIGVDCLLSPVRIDKFVAERMEQFSRSRIQQLIQSGLVQINDEPVLKVSEKVKAGDRILIQLPPPTPSGLFPEAIPLEIVFEDSHIAVINKPPGMCVHPTESVRTGTLVNALLYRMHDLSGIGGVLRPGIVHRLDRGTSGLIIIAKQDEAHRRLSEQFKARQVHKIYWAIVLGGPPQREGEIALPIGRHPADRKRMAVRTDGRDAVTRYKVMGVALGGSWLEVYPVTGRTHQIRVHLKHLGCPVAHDKIYYRRKQTGKGELERRFDGYPGVALHAHAIRFVHPITRAVMALEAALPEIFSRILESFS